MLLKRSHHRQPLESEDCHGTRSRSYIEGVARLDQHHFDAFVLGFGRQVVILTVLQSKYWTRQPSRRMLISKFRSLHLICFR
jgi:hypothetical protein